MAEAGGAGENSAVLVQVGLSALLDSASVGSRGLETECLLPITYLFTMSAFCLAGRRTPSPPELALAVGHAGAVVLRAAVSHTSYALVPRLGVDIPFTHSPLMKA